MSSPYDSNGSGHDGYSEPEAFDADGRRDRDRHRHGTTAAGGAAGEDESALRQRALRNLQGRRHFFVQLIIYVLINAMLFWAWANNGFGFPWPLFVLVFWGIGLMWQGFALFGRGESEDRVRKEMDRISGRR